jgi:branched-chain amino acid transport system permease protein
MRRFLVAVVAVAALVALAPAAGAGIEGPAQEPAGEGGGGEAVRGNLRYDDESGEQVGAEGVTITVESADGSFSETAESDADGVFEVPVPEPGAYTVTLDVDSLPDEVVLRNADRSTLDVTLRVGQARNVLFPLDFGEAATRDVSSTFDRALRLGVQGIRFGLIIAMCAIGLSLIFGTTGLVNFAHGEMVTFGAVVAFWFNVSLGWHFIPAALIAIAIAAAVGGLLDLGVFRPLRRRGVGLIAQLVITIGLSLLARYVILYVFRGDPRSYAQYAIQNGIPIGPILLPAKDLWSIGISVLMLLAVGLTLQKTKVGKAMRAVSDNRDLAESSGIDVQRVILVVWAVGSGLAGLGGVLWGLGESVSWLMGFRLLLLIFAGVILGGLGTAYGALVGSIVVGVFIQMSTLVIPTELKNVGALAMLVIILVVRPQGILGRAERIG